MLCLTRKTGEKIMIGEDVEIVVIRIDGTRVRLGIRAPMDVNIVRGELQEPAEVELELEIALA